MPSPETRKSQRRNPPKGRNVRLRPANSFDLIRLIAHSQSDSRKALSELVQNSLDARARHIQVTRQRRHGEVVISIWDDGGGVFPELERPAALERIATNIGHSFKRNLSVAERQQQMMLGKYGIGILGFWCIGRELEMQSQVGGSGVWALRLLRDDPVAEVCKVRQARIPFPQETWTQIVIRGVHPTPSRQLSARRLGEYLASELRGQLLSRQVELRMVDRLARHPAVKDFLVVPRRFQGRRIGELETVPVEGYTPATLELYLVDEQDERPARVSLTCGGAIVCEDLGQIDGYLLDRHLWSGGRLEGIIEFPDLDVAPSTRRGFVPGPSADSLMASIERLQPTLRQILERENEKQRAEEDKNLAREIRKVFRPLSKSLPQYDFFEIRGVAPASPPSPAAAGNNGQQLGRTAAAVGEAVATEVSSEVVESGEVEEPAVDIFPPGPLDAVHVVPRKCRLLPGASRALKAKGVDEHGRSITTPIEFQWRLLAGDGSLSGEGPHAVFTAGPHVGTARIAVAGHQAGRVREAEAVIDVVDKLHGENPDAGIPEPKRVFDPAGDWRSRVAGRRWEYNAAHPDYQSVVDEPKRRLRYLIHLFAKEMVLSNYGEPNDERLLERMVEVLTYIRP